ncbi:biotin--[acetyl-CoA-carboxylase] ligase [Roseospira goensis]|uniref:biotin--[biotin carboxyl-carrier protein] ligase n=1 Tax=Roseospira goensis TaxID=391922 RepID=A0A7W6S0S3_9PROT|nr:biotin--[acetyl-CoA-carboxylase] ligase [Roseospira goensis]MBB4286597.1 BirA family biotin operon repressor/biotin-[acetyl-CoA-carboxylase] ligase [Roseospira goensis]
MTAPADDRAALLAGAATMAMPEGWRLEARVVVDSTQAVARAELEAGRAADLWSDRALVVWGGEQTGGRGRQGRPWASPPGNLYVTVALPCPDGPRRGVEIGFLGGVALARALGDLGFGAVGGLPEPRLKWPNDVLLDGAKVAGLLPESASDAAGRCWVLLGMGVNVATAPPMGETLYPATKLAAHAPGGLPGAPVPTPADLLMPLLARLAALVAQWRAAGFAPVRAAWLRHGHGLGEAVRVRLGAETVTGVFEGLSAAGALMLREDGGARRTILAGDVFFAAREDG